MTKRRMLVASTFYFSMPVSVVNFS